MVLATSFIASLLLLVAATPRAPRTMVVHESRAAPAKGFVQSSAAPAEQELTLRIALKQNHIAGLETELYKVSDPTSEFYGQHLTLEEVTEFVKPMNETVAAVSSWLSENNIGAKPVTPAGDMLEIKIPVSQANDLLSAEFSVFTHVETGKTIIRTLQYSLPALLTQHVEFFHPTTIFAPPLRSKPKLVAASSAKRATAGSDDLPDSCTSTINPACLQELYRIPTTPATQKSNTLGVAGFTDEWANQEDLTVISADVLFSTILTTDLPTDHLLKARLHGSYLSRSLSSARLRFTLSISFALETLDGGSNPQNRSQAGVEAVGGPHFILNSYPFSSCSKDLDTQYTIGIATGVPVIFISAGDDNPDGLNGFLDMIILLINDPSRPSVLTTSYGFDSETDLPISVAINLCNTYMQLGALGTSLLFSSGDGGVEGSGSCAVFTAPFPAGCPFITSVGSTGFDEEDGNIERGSTFTSGVRSGRGFPDVSAQGENFEIVVGTNNIRADNQSSNVAGTSCSSPTFASIIALLNDELVAVGKPTLGFLNPFLYSSVGRAALNDLTIGINPGCGTDGFFANTGWDPVTGLGTPNYTALRTAVGL
ncbi:family S53 protease [Mycena galopus ATCC 62051]|nr:family S53 protease [Mycena galopus ATCC 62051]